MSNVLIIPDTHLKPWVFERAEEELSKGQYDCIVCLGDLVDDWGQELNLDLYRETFESAIRFIEKYPAFLFCYGNHDISYEWEARESGYSEIAVRTVVDGMNQLRKSLPSENLAFIHKIDNVLFSHAGLAKRFVTRHFQDNDVDMDEMLKNINTFGKKELWCADSPIWVRPQDGRTELYPTGMLQVVGHTPVNKTDYFNGLLTVDNFSTYKNGTPVGDQRFVWVDTVTKEWGFTDKEGVPEKLPDPMQDIRSYREGDTVVMKITRQNEDTEELCEGRITTINRYPMGYVTIDVMGEYEGEKMLYKHFPLRLVVDHHR